MKRISTRCLFAFFGTHCWLRRAFAQNVHWAQIVHIMLGLRFMIYHGESDEEMDDFGVTPIGWQTMCTFHSDDEVSLMQPEKQQVGICLDWWDSPRKVIEWYLMSFCPKCLSIWMSRHKRSEHQTPPMASTHVESGNIPSERVLELRWDNTRGFLISMITCILFLSKNGCITIAISPKRHFICEHGSKVTRA